MFKKRCFATRTLPEPFPLTFEVDGKRETEKFTIKYRSFSPSFTREVVALEEGALDLAKSLAAIVVSITDLDGAPLTNEKGEKVELDAEFFDTVNQTDNLKTLYEAIFTDVRGPMTAEPATQTPASASLPDSSNQEEPAASESQT